MWIVKVRHGERDRTFATASRDLADRIASVLEDFSHRSEVYFVSTHYDPIKGVWFVLDPETNEPLRLPTNHAQRLASEGYVELMPLGSSLAVRI